MQRDFSRILCAIAAPTTSHWILFAPPTPTTAAVVAFVLLVSSCPMDMDARAGTDKTHTFIGEEKL